MNPVSKLIKQTNEKHAQDLFAGENVRYVIDTSDTPGVTDCDVADMCTQAIDLTSNMEDKLLKQLGMLMELKALLAEAELDANCKLEGGPDEDAFDELCDVYLGILEDTCATKAFFSAVEKDLA